MLEETRRAKQRTSKKIQSKTKSKAKKQKQKQTKPFGASYERNEWEKSKQIKKMRYKNSCHQNTEMETENQNAKRQY